MNLAGRIGTFFFMVGLGLVALFWVSVGTPNRADNMLAVALLLIAIGSVLIVRNWPKPEKKERGGKVWKALTGQNKKKKKDK